MGQNLVELSIKGSIVWTDSDVLFVDSPGVAWYAEGVLRMSYEAYADQRFWSDDIISYTPPQFQMAEPTGGYCRMNWGDIEIRLDTFAGSRKASGNAIFTDGDVVWLDGDVLWETDPLYVGDANLWPPPRETFVYHRYTDTDESGVVILFQGSGHLASFNRESVKYDLYGTKYDTDLLETETNYTGDTVSLPRALGAVVYCAPVRLADVGIYPTYHKAYLSGTVPGTDYNVYDDGVDINSNVVDNGDGTFSLTASPVGEVSISGTGEVATLSDLLDYLATELGVSYTYDSALEESPSPSISFWATSQTKLIDFVSSVAAYFEHLFYISGYTLYAVAMSNANSTRTLTEYDIFEASYEYPTPIKQLKATWDTRVAGEWNDGTGGAAGVYVKSEEQEATVDSVYPYGQEESVEPYQYAQSDISTRLASLLTCKHRCQVHLSIPISDDLPAPGEQIIYTDASNFPQDLDVMMYCRSLTYDFIEDKVTIIGDGVVS